MTRFRRSIALFTPIAALLAGCASTQIDAQWSNPDYSGRSLRGEPVLVACEAQELTLLEMTQAYGAMASEGYRIDPHGVVRIRRGNNDETMWSWRQTSNNAREMSDALKRRCMHLYIDFPSKDLEHEIVRLKVPEAGGKLMDEIVGLVHVLRALDLEKAPSISETLDWARALVVMNIGDLDDALVKDTLSTICKYEGDLRKAEKELAAYVQRKRADRERAESASPSAGDKDVLH